MKRLLFMLLLCGSLIAQTKPTARPTYARNGALIGLAGLAPLRDCPIKAIDGKVKSVKKIADAVIFDLESDDERMTFQFPLDRLASAERSNFQRSLLRKGLRLRADGYACKGPGVAFEAINIDRVY